MDEIEKEVVERMVALVRDMERCLCNAPDHKHAVCCTAHGLEARAIVALLPEPVDPDVRRVLHIAEQYSVPLTDAVARAIAAYFKEELALSQEAGR